LSQPGPNQPHLSQPVDPATQTFQPVPPEPGPFEVPRQPVTAVTPKAKGRGTSWINVALGLALAVAIGGVAFAAGRMTAPATAAANGGGAGNGRFGGNFAGGGYFPGGGNGGTGRLGGLGGGGASVQGTVTAVSPTSITLTTTGGQTVTIALNGTTTYHQESSATAGDVKSGGTVIVRLGFGARDGGPTASGAPNLAATDVTVVP
jgi:hypothetical protein